MTDYKTTLQQIALYGLIGAICVLVCAVFFAVWVAYTNAAWAWVGLFIAVFVEGFLWTTVVAAKDLLTKF